MFIVTIKWTIKATYLFYLVVIKNITTEYISYIANYFFIYISRDECNIVLDYCVSIISIWITDLFIVFNCLRTLLILCETMSIESDTTVKVKKRGKGNNVCRKMTFYSSEANNPRECWYNPDVDSYAVR